METVFRMQDGIRESAFHGIHGAWRGRLVRKEVRGETDLGEFMDLGLPMTGCL
jgi:hypothetical protein